MEVYVAPYPVDRGPARQQVSDGGGQYPKWGGDGKSIYYSWAGRIIRVKLNPSTNEIGTPEILNKIQPVLGWVIAPDGRFLVSRVAKTAERHSLKVVLNWAKTLDAKN
jgi:hypothetical protein